jgi:hypothetical protein
MVSIGSRITDVQHFARQSLTSRNPKRAKDLLRSSFSVVPEGKKHARSSHSG